MQGKLSGAAFSGNEHAFDNLLWYFTWQHKVIEEAAKKRAAAIHPTPNDGTEGAAALEKLKNPKHGMTKTQKKHLEQQLAGGKRNAEETEAVDGEPQVPSAKQAKTET